MQYNKNKFNKVNDKKLLKKVKKEWVVVSIASLSVISGFAISGSLPLSKTSNNVYADTLVNEKNSNQLDTSQNNENSDPGKDTHDTSSVKKTQSITAPSSERDNQTLKVSDASGAGNLNEDKMTMSASSNNFDDSKVAPSSSNNQVGDSKLTETAKAGSQSYSNGESKPSTNDNDQQAQYDAASNGFNDKLKQGNTTNDSQANTAQPDAYQQGQNLADQYKNEMNQGAQDYINNKKTDYTDQTQQNYYNASYSGAQTASNAYNQSTSNQGTNGNYDSYNKASGQSYTDYSSKNTAKLNSQNNSSVRLNGSSVNVPSSDSQIINDDKKNDNSVAQNYAGQGVYNDAFRYGINYFLANQGANDAKSGKWQGTNYNQNSSNYGNTAKITKDFYDSNINGGTYDSAKSDAYYQAYEGAKRGIANQFKADNTYNTGFIGSNSNSTNNDYTNAYNSVVNDNKNGIVYVRNAQQMNYVVTGVTSGTGVNNSLNMLYNNNSSINKPLINTINLVNDVNLQDVTTGNSGSGGTNPYTNTNLTINGQNHIADFYGMQYCLQYQGSNSYNFNIKNFQTVYGINYYGPFAASSGSIYFDNFNYVGPQMLQSTNNNVYINGNVNAYQNLGSSNTYNSPFQQNAKMDGSGNQQILAINNLTLGENSNFFGDVSNNTGGTNVQLNGNLTLGVDSNMNLISRGSGGDGAANNGNAGVYLTSSSSKLNVNKGSNLNIDTQKAGSTYGSAIYSSGGQINVNNANINITLNGNNTNSLPVYFAGGNVLVQNGGAINVIANGVNNSSGILYNSGGKINIVNGGNLTMDATNSTNSALIYGNVSVNNPGLSGVNLKVNNDGSTILESGASITANTINVNDVNYYMYNLNGNGNNNLTTIDQTNNNNNGVVPTSFKGDSLLISRVPAAYFVGPVNVSYDSQSKQTTITGNAKISGTYNNGDKTIYIKYSDNNNTDISNPTISQTTNNNNGDTTKFNQSMEVEDNGQLIPFKFIYNTNISPTSVTVLLKYGVSGINLKYNTANNPSTPNVSTTPGGYAMNVLNYSDDANKNLTSNLTQVSTGNEGDVNNGASDAMIINSGGNTVKPNPTTMSNNNDYSNGYNSAAAGYQAFVDQLSNNSVDPTTLNYQNNESYKNDYANSGYADQFEQGFNRAQQDYQTGINDVKKSIANGQITHTDSTATTSNGDTLSQINNDSYQTAFRTFNNGYEYGINGSSSDGLNNQQMIGFNYGKNVLVGASADSLPTDTTDPNYQAQKDGYQSAQQARKDYYNNSNPQTQNITKPSDIKVLSSDNIPNIQVYQSAYYGAHLAGTGSNRPTDDLIAQNSYDAAKGKASYLNGDEQPTTANNSQSFVNGYNDIKQGYSDVIANGSNTKEKDTPSAEYDYGYQIAINSQTGYNKAADLGNPLPNSTLAGISGNDKSAYKGYADAVQKIKSGNFSNSLNNHIAKGSNNDYYVLAYDKAIDIAILANNAGKNAFMSGGNSTTTDGSKTEQNVYTNAYNKSKDGFQDQLNNPNASNNSNDVNYRDGVTLANNGMDGYTQAMNDYHNNPNAYSYSPNASLNSSNQSAYKATIAGLQSANNQNDDNRGKRPTDYSSAFYDAAQASESGRIQAISSSKKNNLSNINNSDSNANKYVMPRLYTNSYNAFINGYSYGQNNPTDNSQSKDTNPINADAYNQGKTAGQQSQGASDYLNNKQPTNGGTTQYSNGYQYAKDGYQAGITGQPVTGITDAEKNSAEYQRAQAAGHNAKNYYQSGVNKAQSTTNPQSNSSDTPTNAVGKDAYNGAADAINAVKRADTDGTGVNNVPALDNKNSSNSIVYNNAYNEALAEAQKANQAGQNKALNNGKDTSYDSNVANDDIYNNAQAKTKTGYSEGINGEDTSKVPSNSNEAAGVDAGKAIQSSYNQAVSDYNDAADKKDAPDTTSKTGINADIYNNAIQGLKDADGNGNDPAVKTNKDNQNPIYGLANSQELAKQVASNVINNNANNSKLNTIDNNNTDAKNSLNPDAYKAIYNAMINGYNDGQSNPTDNSKVSGDNQNNVDAYEKGRDAGQRSQAVADLLAGKASVKNATDTYNEAYQYAKDGYQAGITGQPVNGITDAEKNSAEYQRAQETGKNAKNDYQNGIQQAQDNANPNVNDSNAPKDNDNSKAAYNAVAQALQDAKQANVSGKGLDSVNDLGNDYNCNPVYRVAYNQALNNIKAANKQANSDFNAGKVLNENNVTPANNMTKAFYSDVYNNIQKGYQEGLSNPGMTEPIDSNEQNGFNKGKADSRGYVDAINDFNNGTRYDNSNPAKGETEPSAKASYQETMKALTDAQNGKNDNVNNTSVYSIANGQGLGAHNGLAAVKQNGGSVPNPIIVPSTPSGINTTAYQDAYKGSYDGYNNKFDSSQINNMPYVNAFKQAAQQKGADDYVAGKVTDDPTNEANTKSEKEYDANYANGVRDAQAAYAGDGNGNKNSNHNSNAYQTGANALIDADKGYDAAKTNADIPDSDDTNVYNAYWGAQSGANTGDKVPANVNTNSVAYQTGKNKAQSDSSQGANQYLSDKIDGKSDLTPEGNNNLYNQGYNNQKAFEDGLNNTVGSDASKYPGNDGVKSAYQNGINASSGYKKGYQEAQVGNDKPSADASVDSYNGSKAGYNDAKNSSGFHPDGNLTQKSAYAKAYEEAIQQMNAGAREVIVDGNKQPNDNNQNHQAFNQGYDNQKAYSAGVNDKVDHSNQYSGPSLVAYQNGQKAKEAIIGAGSDAISGKQNTNREVDPDSYDGAKSGYIDGLNGNNYNNISTKPASYQQAYNNAYNDIQTDRANGAKELFKQVSGLNVENNSNVNGAKLPFDKPQNIHEQAQNNGFVEQQGYISGINGGSTKDNPYTDNPYKDIYNQGLQRSEITKTGYQAAQANGNPSVNDSPIKNSNGKEITDNNALEGYKAVAQAYQDVKANKPQSNNTNQSIEYQMAYDHAYNMYNGVKAKGVSDFTKDPSAQVNNPYDKADTQTAKNLYNQSNEAARDGYNSVMNPSQDKASDKNNVDYIAGQKLANSLLDGIKAAANSDKNAPSDNVAKAGYDAANAAIKNGVNDAKKSNSKNKVDPAKVVVPTDIPSDARQAYLNAYEGAYNGYISGYNNGLQNPNESQDSQYNSLPVYKAIYDATFKQGKSDIPAPATSGSIEIPIDNSGHQFVKPNKSANNNQKTISATQKAGELAGYKDGLMRKFNAKALKKYSSEYVKAYNNAFRKAFQKHMPRYIYNLKGMYLHNSKGFNKNTRVKGYSRVTRALAHVFRVLGISYSKNGLPRYRVSGGYITANYKYIADAYYRGNKVNERVRVIKPKGTHVYSSKQFNKHTIVKKIPKNSIIRVQKVEKLGYITRFYIGNGQYISSNKTIVKKLGE
ncbi:DUF5776 domain-containing protein [Apilactobacillus apisilvae]|uniref:DUF5776 domain-containing protein n=1 Tax=Apilactobacillus apisilvae TaxID=2923364 RepID=A0ABY4PH69_9LACO|nr:DUF5776 domain-containing protein [Apilactobacillus apisilvae]UQS84932.1 DUF5776 domain-containing protein [Apilactobacillus apisilvae]